VENTRGKGQRDCVVEEAGLCTRSASESFYSEEEPQDEAPRHTVMRSRAMQALHLLALEPVAETTVDLNSYGFRPKRSTVDAGGQCFIALAKKGECEMGAGG
jgi:hypothetical protein